MMSFSFTFFFTNIFLAIAIICGIIFGPLCAKFINIEEWGHEENITKEFCRFVIGIQVMAAGVALPKAYLRKELVSILILLGPVMIYMWLVSGLLVWALIPGLNFVNRDPFYLNCLLILLLSLNR
jgi:NhaP-type Na+/H+ or K+/H+ antiporter